MIKGIHGITSAHNFHIDYGPDAKYQSSQADDSTRDAIPTACKGYLRAARYQPHDFGYTHNEHDESQQVSQYLSKLFHLEFTDEFVNIGGRCIPAGHESDYTLLRTAGSPDLKRCELTDALNLGLGQAEELLVGG